MATFEGKAAIVTGGSRGIGFAIAQALVNSGASVCITGRRDSDLDEAVHAFDAPGRAIAVRGASDDAAHQHAAVSTTLATFGSVDLLVNNAATNPLFGPLLEADHDALRKILDVNVVAPLAWTRNAWDAWMGANGGVVLNIASVGGVAIEPSLGPYGVSKAGLIQLTRQLALELAPRVRVNGLAPAVVKTQFARALYEGREDAVAQTYPLERLGVPADIADAATYLLGPSSSWVTGQTLVVDGGMTLTTAMTSPKSEARATEWPPQTASRGRSHRTQESP